MAATRRLCAEERYAQQTGVSQSRAALLSEDSESRLNEKVIAMNVLSSLTNAVTGSAKAASAQDAAANPLLTATKPPSSKKEGELKTTFQTFVAGSFYKQMLKSLHKMHKKPAYFHGGRAEEIFQGQMDQEVSETLAKRQGDVLSGTMYKAFAQRLKSAAKS